MLQQMARAARLDRRFYTEILFDDYATGNAVLAVAAVYTVLALALVINGFRRFDLIGFLLVLLGGVIGWLVLAGALWLAGVKLLHGEARGETVLRLAGFAHTPLVLIGVAVVLPSPVSTIVAFGALGWFALSLVAASSVLFDFDRTHAWSATLLAVAGWWVAQIIGIGPGLPFVIRML